MLPQKRRIERPASLCRQKLLIVRQEKKRKSSGCHSSRMINRALSSIHFLSSALKTPLRSLSVNGTPSSETPSLKMRAEDSDEDLTIIDVMDERPASDSSSGTQQSLTNSSFHSQFSSTSLSASPPRVPKIPPLETPILPLGSSELQEFRDFVNNDSSQRQPVLCLVDYGLPGGYASDIWVVIHNTLRRELFDTFEVVSFVRKLADKLTYDDVIHLRKWWRFFVHLWQQYRSHEDTVISPLFSRIRAIDGRSDMVERQMNAIAEDREWLDCKMLELTSYLEEFEILPPARALILFCRGVDRVAERMVTWFAIKERVLPGLIEGYYNEEVNGVAEEALIKRLRDSGRFEEGVVAVIRWMGCVQGFGAKGKQSKEREKWIFRNLSWMERLRLPAFFKRYDAVHGNVVRYFRQRLR